MEPRILEWLVCPTCGEDLNVAALPLPEVAVAIERGAIACSNEHVFPIDNGVPRLLATHQNESAEARSIRTSFSAQWEDYDFEAEQRTWGQTLETRVEDFLRMIDHAPEELHGKLVLDAGCGNGLLSQAVTRFGCEVLAADISDSVARAHSHFAKRGNLKANFIQADLMQPPFRANTFDVVFCAGVLIVTPSSRQTFDKLVKALAPGGTIFVWLYWKESGLKYAIKSFVRRVISPLPLPVKRAVASVFVAQAMLRQFVRGRLDKIEPEERLTWREHFLVQHDFFTPRYRWEHTPDEVFEWYRELGFTDIKLTEQVDAGFGVAARKPGRVEQTVEPERARAPVPA
jgi:2-polyprenyl-3-methyl-5-hydroxy-6-metoxy-1,4-benzoquinol methylase